MMDIVYILTCSLFVVVVVVVLAVVVVDVRVSRLKSPEDGVPFGALTRLPYE